jgi:hypothetical protein
MDDWYILWFKHVFGALQYPQYFALDRPLMGYFMWWFPFYWAGQNLRSSGNYLLS